ncbi:MAG: response regulator [Nitrospirae bacterium]|nr:response regulator [Nitrospirota bacterium]
MKTLIADDNADDRKILRCLLEHHGCQVTEAADGQEALELVALHLPDLIISDALMPRMDGFQFLRAVRTDKALQSVPFVFYSATYTGEEEAALAISLGADAFIIKPKDLVEFWDELNNIVKGCRLRDMTELRAVPIKEDHDYLLKYSNIVANKLEEKVKELENALAQRKQAEEDQRNLQNQLRHSQKLEAIGTLAGGIAHDFNNILSVIVGYANLMEVKMPEGDSMMPYLKEILAAAERATHLSEGLLIFSRKQARELRPVDVNDLVRGMQKMVLRIIGADIEATIILADEKLMVMGDYGQLEQVLMNFVTNARDAMPDGGPLAIRTALFEADNEFPHAHGSGKPGRYALISVSDAGKGMDQEICEKIFEPFFTTKEVGKGTGLGLAIVYGIVQQHNGYINFCSEPGKGTTFKVYLPLVHHESSEVKEADTEASPRGTETILLADDDPNVRKLTKDMLEHFGYAVLEAQDGAEAVRQFSANRERIDLLLFDVIMPKKSGKEAWDEIRQIRSDVKVLFVSGYPDNIIRKKGIAEDPHLYFMQKPVMMKRFLKTIREILDRKE